MRREPCCALLLSVLAVSFCPVQHGWADKPPIVTDADLLLGLLPGRASSGFQTAANRTTTAKAMAAAGSRARAANLSANSTNFWESTAQDGGSAQHRNSGSTCSSGSCRPRSRVSGPLAKSRTLPKHGTQVSWYPDTESARVAAEKQGKMLFVMHLSGNLAKQQFT